MEKYPGHEHEALVVSLPVTVINNNTGLTLGAFRSDVAAEVAANSPVTTEEVLIESVESHFEDVSQVSVDPGLIAHYRAIGRSMLQEEEHDPELETTALATDDELKLDQQDEETVTAFAAELDELGTDEGVYAQATSELYEPTTDDLVEPGLNTEVNGQLDSENEDTIADFAAELDVLSADDEVYAQATVELNEPVADDLVEPGLRTLVEERTSESSEFDSSPFLGDLVAVTFISDGTSIKTSDAVYDEVPSDNLSDTTSPDVMATPEDKPTIVEKIDGYFDDQPTPILGISDEVLLDIASVYGEQTVEQAPLTVQDILLSEMAEMAVAASLIENEATAQADELAPPLAYVLAA